MTDFLDEKKQEIRARLAELKPLVDEYQLLEAAAAALDGVGVATPSTPRATRAPKAPRRAAPGSTQRGRPKGSGTRSKEALALVRTRPGITIPEIADAMGIKQNYLYRVMPELQKDGLVRKDGRGWEAVVAA